MLLIAARAATVVAELVGHHPLRAIARQLDDALTAAVEPFWDENAKAWRSHLPAAQPILENTFGPAADPAQWGIYANAMALSLGLGARARQQAVAAACIRWLQDDPEREGMLNIGWVDILLTPLCVAGYRREILEWLHKRYGPLLATGMPTWPEGFGTAVFNSAHGWGASVNSLIVQGLLGLRPSPAGWTRAAREGCPLPWEWQYRLETRSGNVSFQQAGKHVKQSAHGNSQPASAGDGTRSEL